MGSCRKPHVNVGTIGHVDHGKTTLTAAITKVSPVRHYVFITASISFYMKEFDWDMEINNVKLICVLYLWQWIKRFEKE